MIDYMQDTSCCFPPEHQQHQIHLPYATRLAQFSANISHAMPVLSAYSAVMLITCSSVHAACVPQLIRLLSAAVCMLCICDTQRVDMQDGSVHDYLFDQMSGDWVHWMKTVPQQELPPTLSFNEIIVQTIDTVRYSHLMRLLITHGHHTLFTGQLFTTPMIM